MPWLDNVAPKAPYFTDAFEKAGGLEIRWADDDTTQQTRSYVLYKFEEGQVVNVNDPTKILSIVQQMPDPVFIDRSYIKGRNYIYIVTALDRMHNESMISDPLRVESANGSVHFEFAP